jgi:hypothetical protein
MLAMEILVGEVFSSPRPKNKDVSYSLSATLQPLERPEERRVAAAVADIRDLRLLRIHA